MQASQNKTKALLLMAGQGTRFGSPIPKQFHRLSGKKVYIYALEQLIASQLFDEILLVCAPSWMETVAKEVSHYQTQGTLRLVKGGATRQESSFLGLLACDSDTEIVLIHDGVRPFVTQDILKKSVDTARTQGAVDTCIASSDTIVYAPKPTRIEAIPKRAEYLRGQTPQTFSHALVLWAHRLAQEHGLSGFSDDCSLVLHMGRSVHFIWGDEKNLKITTELDLFLAEQILRTWPQNSTMPNDGASLRGKRYAVTGGTGGIGKAICLALQREGAIPISLSTTSKDYPVDLTSFAATQQTFDAIRAKHGLLDGLINSMGLLKFNPISALTDADISAQIDANLKALIYCCKCAPLKPGGHLINIASSSYSRGRGHFAIYSSTKAAVVNFTQGLAEERLDLRINVVVPQRARTALREDNFVDADPHALLEPKDVANEVIALLKRADITGTIVDVRKERLET